MSDNPFVLTMYAIIMSMVFALFISYMYAGLYTLVRPFTEKMSARGQSISIQLFAVATPIVTVISVLVFFFPSVFTFPTLYGHCHLNQCQPHVPEFFESSNILFSLIVLALVFALVICILVFRERSKLSNKIDLLIELMSDSSTTLNDKSIEIVDSPVPLLLNVGIFTPRIIMSRCILQSFSDSEFQLIVIYELMRCKRYENLRQMISKISTCLWPKFVKRMLLTDLSNSAHALVRDSISTTAITVSAPNTKSVEQLPNYVNALLKTIALSASKATQTTATNNSGMINNIGLTFFSVQYFALMILVTSAMHFLSERFLQ